ncbi:hypothetical protein [Thermocatellispora tengchongensis]|uniref:hypothetical protein n=1 Tax=Thermocatellispora tengchongensis TaxID=1073253 RepID=UPI0036326A25
MLLAVICQSFSNSPVRKTTTAAQASPTTTRSTASAAAPWKSPAWKAYRYDTCATDQPSGIMPQLAVETSCGSTKSCVPVANARISMYAIHLRSIGICTRSAICSTLAPSIRAASMTSCGMLFSAPYMITIQPPAPVQNAITVNSTGRWSGAITLARVSQPNASSSQPTGLAAGSSRISHSSTLATPASAPGR